MILQRELAGGQQELIAPASVVAGVDVEDGRDQTSDVLDGDGLSVEVEDGGGLVQHHGGVEVVVLQMRRVAILLLRGTRQRGASLGAGGGRAIQGGLDPLGGGVPLLGGGSRFSLDIGGALKGSGARLVRGVIGGLPLLSSGGGGGSGAGGRLFGVVRGGSSHVRGWGARSRGGCAGEVGAARREAGARALRSEVPAR
ncbi:glycine-rich cell wall structural protein 1-like [Panicum virgatum]|uniref:glycine-rich cell wall structural protein 1-like n=1 Tax=Panicum virgatum TaxID=38727 RepID=UPI0019D53D4D|nr:glycine-rich cell wall structural protein 1-like [Panicum virgatum]